MTTSPRTSGTPARRLATGIEGFDAVLDGGLVAGGVYVVQGPPGSGKTILANQVAFHHAARGERVVYFSLLTESHGRMLAHLRQMAFFRAELVGDALVYLAGHQILEEGGLPGLLAALRAAMLDREPCLVVLDGMVAATDQASQLEIKKFVHDLQLVTANTGATALLLSSLDGQDEVRPEHTVADGVIDLSADLSGLRALRHLHVRKVRGANQLPGRHSVVISTEGIAIHPRFETRLPRDGQDIAPAGPRRMATGIERLDAMLHGGVPSGSLTMLVGPSGCGKTSLGLQFLATGATRGERGLYFGFYEQPPALLAKCARLGIDVQAGVDAGLLELLWERPIEGVLDVVAEHLMEKLRAGGVTRLCIDGLHSLRRTVDFPERTRGVTGAIAEELARLHVSTMFTLETPQLVGPEVTVPLDDISAVAHNIVLMRFLEQSARFERTLAIIKMRDSDFDRSVVRLEMSARGLTIHPLGGPPEQPAPHPAARPQRRPS